MFRDMLEEVVQSTPGGLGAVLMGYDGIAIDEYRLDSSGPDLQMLAIEYANVLKEMTRMTDVLDTGHLEEVTVKTEEFFFVLRSVNEEYFMVLTIARSGNPGKGRYLMLKRVPQLNEELS